jgi:hypothetical protein
LACGPVWRWDCWDGLISRQWRIKQRNIADTAALVAGLQCALVLAAWGMLPFTLWR